MHPNVILFFFYVSILFTEVKGNDEEVTSFFTCALQCVTSLQNVANNFHEERLYREMDDHTQTLSAFIAALSRYDPDNCDTSEILQLLYRCFLSLLRQHEDRQSECPTIETNNVPLPGTILTGLPGRPRYSITTEQIYHCVSIVMTWQGISSCFGISRRTLFRHREFLGIEPLTYTPLSNEDLNTIVTSILHNTPNSGEAYVLGSLRSRGIRVQRWRVRLSLHQVDPIGRSFRRRHAIRRRVYSVQGPNQLW